MYFPSTLAEIKEVAQIMKSQIIIGFGYGYQTKKKKGNGKIQTIKKF